MTGELRRPPQLWEEKLARTTSILGVGIGSGDATAIVTEPPTPGTDGGVEPAPSLPPEDEFLAPSTPTLSGTVQGIRVSWNGLDKDGDPYPSGAFVEVHISTTGATFTPDATTLAGTLLGSAGFFTIGALTAGTTYYVRLVGVDAAGNRTDPSTAASSQTGLTTTNDYGTATIGSGAVSFDARAIGGITTTVGTTQPSNPVVGDIWLDSTGGAIVHKRWSGSAWVTQAWGSSSISANAITATQIAAGAITAGAIAANAVTAEKINANAVTADKINAGAVSADKIAANAVTAEKIAADAINGKTITGATIQTSPGGNRIIIKSDLAPGGVDGIEFRAGGSVTATVYGDATGLLCTDQITVFDDVDVRGILYANSVRPTSNIIVFQGYRETTDANAVMMRLSSNVTSANQAKFEVDADGDVKSRTNSYAGFSDARFKENITPARDYIDDLRKVEVVTFNWQGSSQKLLGVTAQQIQTIFPNMVAEDEDGTLSVRYSVFVPMLITAVQSLADKVDALTARIEALED
jgi:hypothetical protein